MYYDRKARDRKYQEGDQVLVLLPTDNNKLLLQWKGPYPVVSVVNDWDYRISMKGKTKTFHANMLKRYELREPQGSPGKGVLTVVNAAVIDDTVDENSDTGECSADEHMTCPKGSSGETGDQVSFAPGLSKEQVSDVKKVLVEYRQVLTDKRGRTNLEIHAVRLSTPGPVRIKGYPIPYKVRDTIGTEVDNMSKLGRIEPSRSPTFFPVIPVRKSYRGLRKKVRFRFHPNVEADYLSRT